MSQKVCLLRKRITKSIRCNYLLFLPKGYDPKRKRWPLVLFLHGAGERGNDLALVKTHGVAKIVERQPDFPFIVVSPQCPPGQWWSIETLDELLDDVARNYRVDNKRMYVTGLSMGGYATWEMACAFPHRFAAIAPICGGGNPKLAFKIKHLPVWIFHGAKDRVVPVEESRRMAAALRKAGGDVRLTVYPKLEHDSWTRSYENSKLYDWFLSHQLPASPRR
jgi:predicted peptidase